MLEKGSATCWYTGPVAAVELVMAQMEPTRSRLESFLGREIVHQSPPRILCFGRRSDFEAFFKSLFAHLAKGLQALDGFYIRRPCRTLTICTEQVPYRVVDHEQTACSLFCTYYMETLPARPPAAWLQRGISRTLTSDPLDRARLNRKMLASLAGDHARERTVLVRRRATCQAHEGSGRTAEFRALRAI